MRNLLRTLFISLLFLPVTAQAQQDAETRLNVSVDSAAILTQTPLSGTLHEVRHDHLLGFGSNNVLDTYLSPLCYKGFSVSYLYRTLSRLSRKSPSWRIMGNYAVDFSSLDAPADNVTEWDGNLAAALILHRRFRILPSLSASIGPMFEAIAGFTYNTRNGNNPAQGRVALNGGVSGVAEWHFKLFGKHLSSHIQVDMPILGLMFSPNYGQSYYEIFSLKQYDHNICLNHAFKAPQMRLLATLHIPMWRHIDLVCGYHADIRQSHVNNLKAHRWQHQFVIGITRSLLMF